MTSKKTSKKRAAPAPKPLRGERLKEARRVAREAAEKHPRGVLSLPGVHKPRNPRADVCILLAGDVRAVVYGISDKGKAWIARQADHSDGYEGEAIFGPGAYSMDPALVAPLRRGLDAAGLTVTS